MVRRRKRRRRRRKAERRISGSARGRLRSALASRLRFATICSVPASIVICVADNFRLAYVERHPGAGASMSKNIVLLSDGTGNSSAAVFKTNVWRLFQILDLHDPNSQIAFYGDGVGT